ncbi:MarC family NAAT transporter [Cernens ardua]|uniref:MarC family NAAT transporter n=1 Tax=Cernens ardua TaxID=3402176 RepID=UPI003F9CA2A8
MHYTLLGVLALLPMANPLTSVSLMLSLGAELDATERLRQIKRSTVYIILIMVVCYYGGNFIMSAFGISLPGLRITGGLVVGYIGFTMLFPSSQSEEDAQHQMLSKEDKEKPHVRDLSFVPLALPGTAGPGTIAVIISAAASVTPDQRWSLALNAGVISSIIIIALIYYIAMKGATVIMRVLGKSGIDAISRLVGFLLIGMGVQFLVNGISVIVQQA